MFACERHFRSKFVHFKLSRIYDTFVQILGVIGGGEGCMRVSGCKPRARNAKPPTNYGADVIGMSTYGEIIFTSVAVLSSLRTSVARCILPVMAFYDYFPLY